MGRAILRGLRGEKSPFVSRIIAIADAYEAMSSDRPYRKALPPEQVMEGAYKQ